MARYVLLSFEDNDDADAFVKEFDERCANQTSGPKAYVRGLYAKPTLFCECPDAGKRSGGYTRGKKYGWWVHATCGKPSRGWGRGDTWFGSLGVNLLPISETAPEWRGNGVQGQRWDPDQRQWVDAESSLG